MRSCPYVFDAFALLSLAKRTGLLADFANSPDIINVGVFIVLIIFLVCWLMYACETWANGRARTGTVGRWVYWSITAYSSVGFGGARARGLFACYMRWRVDARLRQTSCRLRVWAVGCVFELPHAHGRR
jgi:hypothetical protein